jgi:hypothetical protein
MNSEALHPVAQLAVQLLFEKAGEASLSAQGEERLSEALAEHFHHSALRFAFLDLISLHVFLKNGLNKPEVAAAILRVATTATEPLRALGLYAEVSQARATQAGEKFAKFAGKKKDLSAPKLGEAAPAGSIRVEDLLKNRGPGRA